MATTRFDLSNAAWTLIGEGAHNLQRADSAETIYLHFGTTEPLIGCVDYERIVDNSVYQYRGTDSVYARSLHSQAFLNATAIVSDSITVDAASKKLYLEFLDIANAPADTLAEWNTYFGFTDVFQSMETGVNWVRLTGIEGQKVKDNLTFSDNLIKFIDSGVFSSVGDSFLANSSILSEITFETCLAVGDSFLSGSTNLNNAVVNLPESTLVGGQFLMTGDGLIPKILNLPKMEQTGTNFLTIVSG